MKSKVALSLAASLVLFAGCGQDANTKQRATTSRVNPLTQPLGANLPSQQSAATSANAAQPLNAGVPVSVEPSAKAMEKMLPYLSDSVYSDAVPTIEMRPFRECFARAIFAAMDEGGRTQFEELVKSGAIYDNSVIIELSRFFKHALESQQIRTSAQAICPKYATAIAAM